MTGWRFAPGNPQEFAEALETALSLDADARAALAVRASDHARSLYAKSGMCASTLRIYAAVFESHKN